MHISISPVLASCMHDKPACPVELDQLQVDGESALTALVMHRNGSYQQIYNESTQVILGWMQAINLGSAMTAHPHVVIGTDPADKRMVTWCWRGYAILLLKLTKSHECSMHAGHYMLACTQVQYKHFGDSAVHNLHTHTRFIS